MSADFVFDIGDVEVDVESDPELFEVTGMVAPEV